MDRQTSGWILIITGVGAMCTLVSADVASLASFHDMLTPKFVALELAHLGAVILAAVGGKILPDNRGENPHERAGDTKDEKYIEKNISEIGTRDSANSNNPNYKF